MEMNTKRIKKRNSKFITTSESEATTDQLQTKKKAKANASKPIIANKNHNFYSEIAKERTVSSEVSSTAPTQTPTNHKKKNRSKIYDTSSEDSSGNTSEFDENDNNTISKQNDRFAEDKHMSKEDSPSSETRKPTQLPRKSNELSVELPCDETFAPNRSSSEDSSSNEADKPPTISKQKNLMNEEIHKKAHQLTSDNRKPTMSAEAGSSSSVEYIKDADEDLLVIYFIFSIRVNEFFAYKLSIF